MKRAVPRPIRGRAMGTRGTNLRTIALLLALLSPTRSLAEMAASATKTDFDCVIEAQQLVKLSSPVVGVIARLDVDRGDVVQKGQILGSLEDTIERANLALARAKATNEFPVTSIQARLKFLRRKMERAAELVARSAGSQANFDEAESDVKVAEQQLKEAELNLNIAQLELQHTIAMLEQKTLHSPVDGLVVERLLLPGEYRNEQNPILTLAQINPLRVEVFVPINYYRQIHVGTNAVIEPEQPIGGAYKALVAVVDKVMDAASGTFGVRLTLPNPDLSLPAGVRCRVKFDLASLKSNN